MFEIDSCDYGKGERPIRLMYSFALHHAMIYYPDGVFLDSELARFGGATGFPGDLMSVGTTPSLCSFVGKRIQVDCILRYIRVMTYRGDTCLDHVLLAPTSGRVIEVDVWGRPLAPTDSAEHSPDLR